MWIGFLINTMQFADKNIFMKKINYLFIAGILFASCDPPKGTYQEGTISIKAQIISPKTNINLGDSVAFYFEVPDTIELNGNKIKVFAGATDGGTGGFDACKIIPSLPGGFTNAPNQNTCLVFPKIGTYTINGATIFYNDNGKLKGLYYMIPQQKGVYFFDERQKGYVDLNNKTYKLRFSINFGNINRNHQMLIDSAGVANNFNNYLQAQLNNGLEIYGFKVN
jgi:hypothetical protein